jgi:hypothetical protein
VADIVIHRCTLHVARRGGWSWGPDPKHLVEEVVRILPHLLAQKLAELLAFQQDTDFVAPLRVHLRLHIDELTRASSAAIASGDAASLPVPPSLERRAELALRLALGMPAPPQPASPGEKEIAKSVSRFTAKSSDHTPRQRSALEHLLRSWLAEDSLQRRLASLPVNEVELWHSVLNTDPHELPTISSTPAPALTALIEARARELSCVPLSLEETSPLHQRLLVATRIAVELRICLSHPVLWQVLDRFMPMGENDVSEPPQTAERSTRCSPSPSQAIPPQPAGTERLHTPTVAAAIRSSRTHSAEWEMRIGCALPFLLLGPLHQLGYLTALAAVLEATGLENEALVFAHALAYKVLDAPTRGWQRTPASRLAAAAFAGISEPLDEELLVEFARKIGSHTTVLDLTLADALIQGRRADAPVTLCRAGVQGSHCWLLVDTPGCFPIACVDSPEDVLHMLARLKWPVVLVPKDAAEPSLLANLDAAGVLFICGLPPSRKERWRRIQGGPSTLGWTNSPNSQGGDLELLERAARELEAGADEAQALWQAVAVTRPGVVTASPSSLEWSLTLAASVALGTISWQLWQHSGRTSPQQALQAYSNLDAHVRFAPDSVSVRLPLGRRRSALYEAGFLASISDIPWLGERRVEYEGG